MDLGLKHKTALVLGGGGGLGSAIAAELAGEGASVAIADIDVQAADRIAGSIGSAGGKAMALQWDIADLSLVAERIASVEKGLGSIDILVNITGGPPPTPASGQDATLWSDSFRSMVLSVIAIADGVLPSMRERKWGRIITSASSGVVAPIPNLAVSNALRLSLVGWSKSLAREIARDGVTTNIVVPGRILTERIRFLDRKKAEREGRTEEEVSRESTGSIPVGRYGDPGEYAAVVAFLASARASYVTGSVVRVDGGLIASV